eukprot:1699503-Amphidinium_carterae.1
MMTFISRGLHVLQCGGWAHQDCFDLQSRKPKQQAAIHCLVANLFRVVSCSFTTLQAVFIETKDGRCAVRKNHSLQIRELRAFLQPLATRTEVHASV